jgi:DNA-binding IclR family transcriptional regulator
MLSVLRLVLANGPMPVSDLLSLSRLDFSEFARVRDTLVRTGLVEVREEGGVQVAAPVEPTPTAASVKT